MNMITLDARELAQYETAQAVKPGFLKLKVKNSKGQFIELRDFGSVGQGRASYFSWLPVNGVAATPFTKDNPSRTSRAMNQ